MGDNVPTILHYDCRMAAHFWAAYIVEGDKLPTKKRDRMERSKPLTIEEAKKERLSPKYVKRCRYCMQEKVNTKFYNSTDFLDTDGKMSVCIDCCSYLFNEYYSTHSRIDIAIYEVCHALNVRYDSGAYSSLMNALEKNNIRSAIKAIADESYSDSTFSTEDEIAVNPKMSLFGKYLSILRGKYSNKNADLTFDLYSNDRPEGYEDRSTDKPVDEIIKEIYGSKIETLEKKWVSGLTDTEYSYLEDEYDGWAKMVDVDDKSVDTLVKEICLQGLSIRKKRENGDSISKQEIETLTNLMEACKLSPAKKTGSTKDNRDCFGVWLKDIESSTPAEWVENQKLFKDVEGIDGYVEKHFNRALKNYIGMQRDFRVVAARLDEEAENFDASEIMTDDPTIEDEQNAD